MSDWWSADPVIPQQGGQGGAVQPSAGSWWTNDPPIAPPGQSGFSRNPVTAPEPPGNFEPVQHAENYRRIGREGVAPEAPSVGILEALGRGGMQGATAGWGDELAGLHAAAGGTPLANVPFLSGLEPIIGGARLGYETLTGKPGSATQAYETTRDAARRAYEEAERQRPGAVLAGNVAGAVALPVGNAARGGSLGVRTLRGAQTGGILGAVTGAGEGETLGERASGAVIGGVTGATVGAAASPVVEGVIQGGRALARPVMSAIQGAINPGAVASRRIVEEVRGAVLADPNALARMAPQEWQAFIQAGGPARIIDLGGENTRALARAAANLSPEARTTLNQAIDQRYEGQSTRIADWLDRSFGFPNATARQEALDQTARTVNSAAYRRAYQEGSGGLWSGELERLAGSDAVTDAMQRAAKAARDEAIVGGGGAFNPKITFTPDGRMQMTRGPSGTPTYPDLQFWDLTRRELSDAAIRAGRGTSEARRLESFARALNTELDHLVPSYQQARQGAASFFGAENALEAGQRYVTENFANNQTRAALARMTPAERQLFQDGFVSRYTETLRGTADRRNTLNLIGQSPVAREKLQIALGPQRTRELEAGLRVEGIMDLARNAVQGNSTTTRQLVELGLVGASGGYAVFYDPHALIATALVGGRHAIDRRVATHIARQLMSQDPHVLQRGLQSVARNDRIMNGLRAFDSRITAAGSEQAASGMQ